MEEKNLKGMSNSDIELYKKTLENEFDFIKSEINSRIDKLNEIEQRYLTAEKELVKRSKK